MESERDEGEDPTDAFALLGNETRMGIVRELADAGAIGPGTDGVGFERLRERVGVADSGRFNYHLDQLQPQFVEKAGDGYVLSYGGQEVISAIHAGTYTDDHADSGTSPCPVCDAAAEVTYEDGFLSMECPNDHPVRTTFPPGAAADRSVEDLVSAALLLTRQDVERILEGVCARCYGTLGDPSVEGETIPFGPGDPTEAHLFVWTCPRCDAEHNVPPAMAAARHSTVLAFHYERGVDLLEDGPLARQWTLPGSETVVAEDPLRFEVTMELDGDRLAVVVDDRATVVSADRP